MVFSYFNPSMPTVPFLHKHCSPRSDPAEHGIWSGFTFFQCLHTGISIKKWKKYTRHPLNDKWTLDTQLGMLNKSTGHICVNFFLYTGNCMSEFMGLILGRYEAKVGISNNTFISIDHDRVRSGGWSRGSRNFAFGFVFADGGLS